MAPGPHLVTPAEPRNKNARDRLIMLLGTDWFFPYWNVIALDIDTAKRTILQQGCRSIVQQILSGAKEYWLTSFSEERLRKTRSMLKDLLVRSGVKQQVADRIEGLIVSRGNPQIDDGAKWLVIEATRRLVANSADVDQSRLDPAIKRAMVQVLDQWDRLDLDQIDFERLGRDSNSQWDQYIRNMTPDLPTYLSDYLKAELFVGDKFAVLWHLIETSLNSKQKEELLNWYRTAAQSLTGGEVELPSLR